MNVYKVFDSRPYLDQYDRIVAWPSLAPQEACVGLAKGPDWKPPALRRFPHDLGRADIYRLDAGAMLVAPRAMSILLPILQSTTTFEAFPLPTFEGEELTVVHVVGFSDECLDLLGPASYRDEKYAFIQEKIPNGLFKVTPTCRTSTLVPERTGHPETEFRAAVLHHDLGGISFQPVCVTDYRVAGCGDYLADAAEYDRRGALVFPEPQRTLPPPTGRVRVYGVLGAGREFQRLEPLYAMGSMDLAKFFKEMWLGRPLAATWCPEPVFTNPHGGRPSDINMFRRAAPVLTPRAVEALRGVFELGGVELLPQPHCGTLYRILNVIRVLKQEECMDMQQTKFRDHGIPTQYAFIPERVPAGLFKVPRASHVMVPERTGDPKTEFKAAVEHHGLDGIRFELLWEG